MVDFDRIIDRKKTDSVKWNAEVMKENFGEGDLLPLWIADMDFEVAPAIKEAVMEVAELGIYGYASSRKPIQAFKDFINRRFAWEINEEWVTNTPGVVTAFNLAIQTFSQVGDKVLIQRPVYYPFSQAIENNGRHIVSNSLLADEYGYYTIDFDDFERKAKDPLTSMFILCSPHNPVGRVWKKEELSRMLDICLENNVFVVIDEIHNDLIMPGFKHYPAGSLGTKYLDNILICMAPSKTFNLAGMNYSNIIIPNTEHRRRFNRGLEQLNLQAFSPFALAAAKAAYSESDEWLDNLIEYIRGNELFAREKLESALDKIIVTHNEGTYLLWLDFNAYGLELEQLHHLMFKVARVALDDGFWFGPEGYGYMRMNLAFPRSVIEEGVNRIIQAVKSTEK